VNVIVGTVKEVKTEEYRVGLTPHGVHTLRDAGHRVLVEREAGAGSGFDDAAYEQAGADLVDSADKVWQDADLVVKVKEPQPEELDKLRPGLTLFTYLHLAALPEVTGALLDRQVTAIAYETVQLPNGALPLLVPMSQIAGRMATEVGAQFLRKPGPGRGKLLSGLPGVAPARVVILGSGTVSSNACAVAVGLEAHVTMLARNLEQLRHMEMTWRGRVAILVSNRLAIAESLQGADLLVCGVLVTGGIAPKLVSREMVRSMGPGAVVVDVSIDQGGCTETSRPTTHADPIYIEEGVVHYCVPNMPGAVPQTATGALTAATLPYLLRLAELGPEDAMRADSALAKGLNTYQGHLTYEPVARAQDRPYTPVKDVL
jgi:alanine dehydrogenase